MATTQGRNAGQLHQFYQYAKSRVFVTAGGNEGNASHHFFWKTQREPDLSGRGNPRGEDNKGFIMDLWGNVPYFYNAVIRTPGGETARWNNPRSYIPQEFTFVYERTRLIIEYQLVESLSGARSDSFPFSNRLHGSMEYTD